MRSSGRVRGAHSAGTGAAVKKIRRSHRGVSVYYISNQSGKDKDKQSACSVP